jgi:hypothetical protein
MFLIHPENAGIGQSTSWAAIIALREGQGEGFLQEISKKNAFPVL